MALVEFINNTEPYLNAENLNNNFQYCLPTGGISIYAGTTAPEGYLICDGSAISRTNYADLFEIIGTTYGDGDGTTTFNIPNLKGRVPVGYDSVDESFDTVGETGGEKTHTLTVEEMPSHKHDNLQWSNDFSRYPISLNTGDVSTGYKLNWTSSASAGGGISTTNKGGGQSHNILQPYIVMNYIIKY